MATSVLDEATDGVDGYQPDAGLVSISPFGAGPTQDGLVPVGQGAESWWPRGKSWRAGSDDLLNRSTTSPHAGAHIAAQAWAGWVVTPGCPAGASIHREAAP